MTDAGARLAQAQVDGHLALDSIYHDLAEQVEAEVLRWETATDGESLLPAVARALILARVDALLDAARLPLTEAVMAARREAIAAAEYGHEALPRDMAADLEARAETWRTMETQRSSVINQLGAILVTGVVRKLAVREIARRSQQYFAPWFAPRRNVAGTVVRAGRQGAIASWPGRAGMASQHARLVMLYQTTSAHGQTILRIAQRDNLYVRYYVSRRHRESDSCDQHARRDVGHGAGVYQWGSAPRVPQHLNCRCYWNTTERDTGGPVRP